MILLSLRLDEITLYSNSNISLSLSLSNSNEAWCQFWKQANLIAFSQSQLIVLIATFRELILSDFKSESDQDKAFN